MKAFHSLTLSSTLKNIREQRVFVKPAITVKTPPSIYKKSIILLSVLGVIVFFAAGDVPVGIVFIGLALISLTESPTRFGVFPAGARLVGL
jgi:hypothetical protein